jgi:soluble lytic murein transglycosylase-like protein
MSQDTDISVAITGDTSDLQKKLAGLKKELADLRVNTANNSTAVADKALKQAEASAKKASDVLINAKQNVKEQKDLLVQAEKELAEAKKRLESTQQKANSAKALENEATARKKNQTEAYKEQIAINAVRKAKLAEAQAEERARKKQMELAKAKETPDKAMANAPTKEAHTKAEREYQKALLDSETAVKRRQLAEEKLQKAQERRKSAQEALAKAQSNVTNTGGVQGTASKDELQGTKQAVSNAEARMKAAQKAVESAVKAEEKATNDLVRATNQKKSAQLKVDTAQARQKITAVSEQIKALRANTPNIKVKANTGQAQTQLSKLERVIQYVDKAHTVSVRASGVNNLIHQLALVSAAFYGIKGVMNAIQGSFDAIIGSGLEYQKQIENARIGIASIYASMTQINGTKTTFEQGLGIANEVVDKLQQVAAVTAATPKDLLTTFQGLAGPGLGAGMTTDELIKFTTTGVNAAKAMMLPPTQFIQELRDLVQGGIQPASSTIATALGLRDSDIKAMKSSADGLFKSLMEKMEGFSEGAGMYTETITGKMELLKQAFVRASAEFTSTFEVEIKSALDGISSLFADIDTKAGTFTINPEITDTIKELKLDLLEVMDIWGGFDEDTGKWYPSEEALDSWDNICSLAADFRDLVLDISDALVDWTPVISSAVDGLTDGLSVITDILDGIVSVFDYTGKIAGKNQDILDLVHDIVEVYVLYQALVKSVYIITGLVKSVMLAINLAKKAQLLMEKGIVKLQMMEVALTTIMKAGIAGIAALTAGGIAVMSGALDGVFNSISSKIDGLIGSDGSGADDSYRQQLEELDKRRKENYGQDKHTDPQALRDARARQTNKTDDKAEKQRLQALQKSLNQILKRIDNALKDQLQQQKEHMEKVELLNKQSKMSVDAYYAEKANNDKIIAEKSLSALEQKKEAILSIEWPEDKLEERDTKLEQINAEMAKQTRALELAAESITGLKDLKEIIRQDFARNNPQQSESDVVREKSLSAIETELIKFAEEHGWDNPGETIKQVMDASIREGIDARELVALIQQESGGKRNAKSPRGAIGLTQLMPETAAEVGVNPYDWRENINGGAAYLAKMRRLFVGFDDILERAFAAYNAGAGAVQEYGGIPPYGETQAYVKAIFAYLEQMSGVPDTRYLPKPSASSTYGFYATGDNMLRGSKFDSRYLDESHSVGGVTKLDGIQDIVYSIFNQVAKDYFDKTGERLVITGGSEDGHTGGSEDGHTGGEFSHGRGWKLDISVPKRDRELLAKLLDSAGIAAGNEGNHWDLSFGGGGIGGPPVNSRQTGNLHNTPTLQNFTAKSELQLEYLEKYRKLQDDSLQDRIKIAELYGDATEEKIAAIDAKYLKQIAEIYAQFPNKMGEERVAQLKVLWDNEKRNVRFEGAEKQLKYTLKDLEASSEAMGDKIVNGAVSLKDGIDKYYDHFTGDNSSVKKYLDELETLMREYESQGNLEMYWKVRDEIENTKKSLTNMISSWLSKIDERFSFESNMVDANWTMTSGQKEREKQAIEQAKQRVKADAYAEQIKQTAIELKEWQEKLNDVIAELEKATDDKAKYALEQEKAHIQGKINELSQLQVANQRAYELASALGHVKTLLEETRQTAKQALEDGLVEFLTDGIQQAESLGDALRNLAVSFLKTMNQFFAKKVVSGLMDAWFPEEGFSNKETDYTSGAETATAATEQVSMATEQSITALEANTSATENLTTAMNNAPAQGAEGTATTTAGTASNAASTANSATASGGAVQQTGGGTATQAGAPSTSNFITNIFGSSLGQLAGSLFSLKNLISGDTKERLLSMIYLQLQLIHQAVTALSFSASSGFATGGYISGAGTATSDSIPAMLSNGEYVVKASAVRQYGRTMLDRINSGSYERLRVSVPKFATGGYVGSTGAKATNNFATSFGASVSPQLHVNNYVDGKRVFDSYGKEVVRSEVTKAIVQNAKLYSKTLGLF